MRVKLRNVCSWIAILAVVAPASAAEPQSPAKPTGARIEGSVRSRSGDASSPARGGRVLAYEVAAATLRATQAIADDGSFRIEGLPHGWYELAVEFDGALYVGNRALDLDPGSVRPVKIELLPPPTGTSPRRFPGSPQEPTGLAVLEKQTTTKEFWFGGKGIAILGGVGAAALIGAAIASDDDEPLASPSNP